MFWKMKGKRLSDFSVYVPPTELVYDMKFQDWLKLARKADDEKLDNSTEHFYFMMSANAHLNANNFISNDLGWLYLLVVCSIVTDFSVTIIGVFSTSTENFFVTNVAANKGIQCRFSMRGIISEAHYDSGKNMVSMLKGAKRYILTPPSSCEKLGIITDPSHPSYRHSAIDWSNLEEARNKGFGDVPAIDTVVNQGEVLYIPSFWFHYIISLQYSIQCNTRSGTPLKHDGKKHIEECLGLHLDFSR